MVSHSQKSTSMRNPVQTDFVVAFYFKLTQIFKDFLCSAYDVKSITQTTIEIRKLKFANQPVLFVYVVQKNYPVCVVTSQATKEMCDLSSSFAHVWTERTCNFPQFEKCLCWLPHVATYGFITQLDKGTITPWLTITLPFVPLKRDMHLCDPILYYIKSSLPC